MSQQGPAEMDELSQEGGRFSMRAGMMFSQLAEMDARRREAKAKERAARDEQAARAAQAKAQAARGVAEQKIRMVMHPRWAEAVGRNEAAILDAARTAHLYRHEMVGAGQALGKIDQHVKSTFGVPLTQWQPKVREAPTDVDHPVVAQATVESLNRRDGAEADAREAEAAADKSAKEARDAEGQTDQAVGSTHLAEAVKPPVTQHKSEVGAAEFRQALRATSKAFPGANKASCTRASAPKARKQRGQGRGQGRSRDLGM